MNEKQFKFCFQSVAKTNIQNLSLNIMFLERGGKKVLLPADSSGLFRNINYGNKSSIRLIDLIGTSTEFVTDMSDMFRDQNSLIFLNLRNFNTSNVNDMREMFAGCTDLSFVEFNENSSLSDEVDMTEMFEDCRSLQVLIMPKTRMYGNIEGIYKRCISLSTAPGGAGKMSIIQSDVHGAINMIEASRIRFLSTPPPLHTIN